MSSPSTGHRRPSSSSIRHPRGDVRRFARCSRTIGSPAAHAPIGRGRRHGSCRRSRGATARTMTMTVAMAMTVAVAVAMTMTVAMAVLIAFTGRLAIRMVWHGVRNREAQVRAIG